MEGPAVVPVFLYVTHGNFLHNMTLPYKPLETAEVNWKKKRSMHLSPVAVEIRLKVKEMKYILQNIQFCYSIPVGYRCMIFLYKSKLFISICNTLPKIFPLIANIFKFAW